jgi:hypothetical protein
LARALKDGRGGLWRAWVARLVALVFMFQGASLFAAPPACPMAMGGAVADAHAGEPHTHFHRHGDNQKHNSCDACPMCQALGCALPGAPPPIIVVRAAARVILLASPAAQRLPPRSQPLSTPPARGPPVLV